jgi:SAM-dependent methyltransferase
VRKEPPVSDDIKHLYERLLHRRTQLERLCMGKVVRNVWRGDLRRTPHFREWYRVPMNYVRMMEIPLAMELLDAVPDDRLLDISSPKFLTFYYAFTHKHLINADVDDYFVPDFETFYRVFGTNTEIQIFKDGELPLREETLDKVFSVSVFEHIAADGDRRLCQEVARVLVPGGAFVVTLPAAEEYFEEWQKEKRFYWDTVQNEAGDHFYQRRYNEAAVRDRLSVPGMQITEMVFIAERPLEDTYFDENGLWMHNNYFIEALGSVRFAKSRWLKCLPMLPYYAYRRQSIRHHYLTRDGSDPNIRQVVVKFVKT